MAERRTTSSGDETRHKILTATLETLRTKGIVGTSARAIAKAGDFNQALIFYHFDSVDNAIVEAIEYLNVKRIGRLKEQISAGTSLKEMVELGRELDRVDTDYEDMTILIQAFAGAGTNPEMGTKLYERLEPWNQLVEDGISRILSTTPLGTNVSARDLSIAISSMFLGIELLADLNPEAVRADDVFATLADLAGMLEAMMGSPLMAAINAAATPQK